MDAGSEKSIGNFAPVDGTSYASPGSSVLAIARKVPIDGLAKGAYRLEVQATDSEGRTTVWRKAEFVVE